MSALGPITPSSPTDLMRKFLALALVALIAGCATAPTPDELGRVTVVDRRGTPLQSAVLSPDPENPPAVPRAYDDAEIKERSSDANGVFHVDMDDCIWSSDGCYHFRIHRAGFDDFTMVVSKELFPPMLRVEMRDKVADAAPSQTR
jgi:hypothetical protein